jgi:hypothetical protein
MSNKPKPAPSSEHLHVCFAYLDGALYWRTRPREHFRSDRACNMWNAKFAGKIAGRPMAGRAGYAQVGLDGERHLLHRLIAAMHGVRGDIIDHIDGDPSNSRIENLRACTAQQNAMNNAGWPKKAQRVGVHRKPNGRFVAYIRADGKQSHLGTFVSEGDAALARAAAERVHYGEFARHKS